MKQMFRGVASENKPDGNILAETNLLTDHNKGDGAGEGVGLSQLAGISFRGQVPCKIFFCRGMGHDILLSQS